MQRPELEKFLYQQIPLVKTMGVQIVEATDHVVKLKAPLEPNHNHLGTVFGGSTYSLSVLACYTWLFNVLHNQNLPAHVVIKNGQMKYSRPVDGEFTSICHSPTNEDFEKFFRTLKKRHKAPIFLQSEIQVNSQVAGLFTGEFIAKL